MSGLQGVVRGKTIELEEAPGLPDGQRVAVEVRPLDEPPAWLERFAVNPEISPGKFVIKGTVVLVDDVVQQVEDGRGDEELLRIHPELSVADLEAVHQYARVPKALRRSFGGWAEDVEGLDEYLEWTRRQRKVGRREIEE
jgi:uncharacterized protein (DUF433 family)